jgi:hypothetical protein
VFNGDCGTFAGQLSSFVSVDAADLAQHRLIADLLRRRGRFVRA